MLIFSVAKCILSTQDPAIDLLIGDRHSGIRGPMTQRAAVVIATKEVVSMVKKLVWLVELLTLSLEFA